MSVKNMLPYFCSRKAGFSFGETLLSVAVLSIGLLTVVKLFQVTAQDSFIVRDATVASALAQEGLEVVRNIRDADFVAGGTGFASFANNKKHCSVTFASTSLNCSSSQNDPGVQYGLRFDAGSRRYVEASSGAEFQRYIYIDYNNSGPSATVRSFVVWGSGNLPPANGSAVGCNIDHHCVYTEMVLTNWKS
jgi:hypothetical protein